MKIKIITVGKIKEKFYKSAIEEFSKRLSAYSKIEFIEVQDEKTYEDNESGNIRTRRIEADRILTKIGDTDYVVVLDIYGMEYTSEEFARKISSIMMGNSTITFIIGGSVGLDERIKSLAHLKLSFSKFTFPHNLMKLILMEQIYRAFKILKNEPYHK